MAAGDINEYKEEIVQFNPSTEAEIEAFRLKWLSKKGLVQSLMEKIKDIPPAERREYGRQVNELKKLAEDKFRDLAEKAGQQRKKTARKSIDLTLEPYPFPLGSLHPLTIVRNQMTDIFTSLGFAISEGPEIVNEWENFTALNMPANHPARDMQDTFFIARDPDIVLRTHTSSVQVKVMQGQQPPIRTISPGRVFRKDSDATHSPVFHQIEGLYIDVNVSFADLKQVLFAFVQRMFGDGTKIRFRPSYFPFTEPSAEMDILGYKKNSSTGESEPSWIEVLGCGLVDPIVLENCGIDSEKYTGFAFGIGIERIAMVKYNIQDIRLFYENDVRFLKQFSAEI